mmetsp:Transcript_12772/g.36546  ORF Transcript_12772/g.36546 Transcript_12772/m.36546 type:complete len:200 (-) Transcript_12772:1119-1718(-)
MTHSTFFTSRPLAATSVATRIPLISFVNASSAFSLARCCMPACRVRTGKPSTLRTAPSRRTDEIAFTKTIVRPGCAANKQYRYTSRSFSGHERKDSVIRSASRISGETSTIFGFFPARNGTASINSSNDAAPPPPPPPFRNRFFISEGSINVAENTNVWNRWSPAVELETIWKMDVSSWKCPCCTILSASSSTRYESAE